MTAPDPLGCLNSRAAAERTTCGEPDSAHCDDCAMCPGACTCHKPTPLDTETLNDALNAFARHGGATSWNALVDVVSHTTAESYRSDIAAAVAPLQARIRRLTAEVERLSARRQDELDALKAKCGKQAAMLAKHCQRRDEQDAEIQRLRAEAADHVHTKDCLCVMVPMDVEGAHECHYCGVHGAYGKPCGDRCDVARAEVIARG
jgi:uncharacterized small protein (DUF1192 family)